MGRRGQVAPARGSKRKARPRVKAEAPQGNAAAEEEEEAAAIDEVPVLHSSDGDDELDVRGASSSEAVACAASDFGAGRDDGARRVVGGHRWPRITSEGRVTMGCE